MRALEREIDRETERQRGVSRDRSEGFVGFEP
jgi:hypothetical protein